MFSIVVVLIYSPTNKVYEGSFFSHPCQHLLLFVFLMIAILTGVRWDLNVFFICISFMARDVEHSFMYLLAICTFRIVCFGHLSLYCGEAGKEKRMIGYNIEICCICV
jgi:hypothetical protein